MNDIAQKGRAGLARPDDGPVFQDNGSQLKSSTAMRTRDRLLGLKLDFDPFQVESMSEFDQSADGIEFDLGVGIHEAEVLSCNLGFVLARRLLKLLCFFGEDLCILDSNDLKLLNHERF